MMTREEAIDFGRFSAVMALDQKLSGDAFDDCRENIRCTLMENSASQWEYEAWDAFDAHIAANR
jgi:hypothetical protein